MTPPTSPLLPPEKRIPFFRSACFDILLFIAVLLLSGLVFHLLMDSGEAQYPWDWETVPQYIISHADGHWQAGLLLQGLAITLQIAAVSLAGAFLVGLVTALLRRSDAPAARFLATLYLEVSRNTPLLIQIFFIYFVLGPVLGINRFWAAVLSLSCFDGAYAAEIFRSGIESVGRGQFEAAKSLGLSPWITWRKVIIPLALRNILPPLASQSISLVKDSALVGAIAIFDLTQQGKMIIANTYLTFEIWLVVGAIYIVITAVLSLTVSVIESRVRLQ
jgi:polar amino acid transport system permease protein